MTKPQTSILGLNWCEKPYDERLAMAIQQKFELNYVLARLISAHEIPLEEVDNFLNPSIKTALPNPFDLLDMEEAVGHVIDAVRQNKKITIFADYDVDGATSSAILKRFFASINVDAEIYVPDRILEGYGPNVAALLNLKKNGTDLVITVDCGTVAFEPLEEAHKAGLEIIVIDHHIGVLEKPKALAVINPNRIDENFPHKNICAATVCFLFAVAINKRLREIGFYGNPRSKSQATSTLPQGEGVKEPNLLALLDLVALGTVCDVMPLTGLNRALVAQGLKILRQRKNLGIRALCDIAGLDEEPSAHHLGFVIGPRINAGGRVGKSDLGAIILSSSDEGRIAEIAARLDQSNAQRKDIETQVLESAISNLEKSEGGFTIKDDIIFAAATGWHQGVIGIVASRLKDLYGKPTVVIATDNNKGKASCRSINGIDFGNAILQARLNGLLIEGGGHAMAGGFSIKQEKISELHKFFCDLLGEKTRKIIEENSRDFDLTIDLENINIELIKSLQKLEPYGSGNKRPKFLVRNLRKMNAKIIGKTGEHISCNFSSLSNIGFAGNLGGVAFRSVGTKLAEILLDPNFKKPLSVIGDLNINSWMGNDKVQLIIEDIIV